MGNAALNRCVALPAALVVAVMATAACYHHHGPVVLDAAPDHPSVVSVADEGPAACAVCSGDPVASESALVAAPAPEPTTLGLRLEDVVAEEFVALASASPRSPPAPADPAA